MQSLQGKEMTLELSLGENSVKEVLGYKLGIGNNESSEDANHMVQGV